jgi:hypothetical protein
MSLNEIDGPLAGGIITVGGIVITVPKNLSTILPAIAVAWPELFVNGVPNLPGLGSVAWQANVLGNRVGNVYTVGLVCTTQQANQVLQGFIADTNMATGHFRVAGYFVNLTYGLTACSTILPDSLG